MNYKNEATDRLFEAILSLKNEEECAAFLEDLCTVKELHDMGQRLETAVLLSEGTSYQKISEKVGISSATVSRVNRCLVYGDGGYREIISRLKERKTNE
ncbi:MAG: YerC/YecD family TrpR-related protein [Lachnospiraceae bacterium]|nr:YerC/YecD family TrpR-related protein [Lachnospiraceae bacterium]